MKRMLSAAATSARFLQQEFILSFSPAVGKFIAAKPSDCTGCVAGLIEGGMRAQREEINGLPELQIRTIGWWRLDPVGNIPNGR